MTWPLEPGLDNAAVEVSLSGAAGASLGAVAGARLASVHRELKGKYVTLQTLWKGQCIEVRFQTLNSGIIDDHNV